jgi:hypothetical protein
MSTSTRRLPAKATPAEHLDSTAGAVSTVKATQAAHPDSAAGPPRLDLVGATTVAMALIVSVSYALLNAAYLEFYSSVGVRPEEVGLDRLALLGRTAGLLVAIIAATFLLFLAALAIYVIFRRTITRPQGPLGAAAAGMAYVLISAGIGRAIRAYLAKFRTRLLAAAVATTLLAAATASVIATVSAGNRAELVASGIPVRPLRSHCAMCVRCEITVGTL